MRKNQILKRAKKAAAVLLAVSIAGVTGYTGNTGIFETTRISSGRQAVTVAAQTSGAAVSTGSSSENISGMRNISSTELVKEMTVGWNLGNTLDVCNADRNGDGKTDESSSAVDETLWGNPRTTKEMITKIKESGINSIRIPVTWRDHMGGAPDYKIDPAWMARVKEVVDYAHSQGMYVIINLHHDGGSDEKQGAWIISASEKGKKDEVLSRYTAVWNQIAGEFKNYDDHLIFESMNEVGFDGMPSEQESYGLLNEFNQKFVDVVRASGGNNASRHLLIAGYWTDIEKSCSSLYKMPSDPAGRCILSVHYYTPSEFCINGTVKKWGSAADVKEMKEKFSLLKKTYTSKGIPVIIGEFGTSVNVNKKARVRFCESVVARTKQQGIPCYFWDNGEEFDRNTLTWRTRGLAEGMVRAASDPDSFVKAQDKTVKAEKKARKQLKKAVLSKKKLTLKAGEKKKLKVEKKPSGVSVTWKSTKPGVAKVSDSGKVKALKKGKTVIKVKLKKNGVIRKLKCKVTVA